MKETKIAFIGFEHVGIEFTHFFSMKNRTDS